MAGDRDLAVAVVRARFPRPTARAWEMLAATGVRGLRLLHEGGGFASLLATEAHPVAAGVLAENVRAFPAATARIADAMRRPPEAPFEYVDLDPYGSPLPFLETAVAATADGGVLAVTATDLMVLAGVQPGACARLYHARPVRGRLGPEGGLRILLARVADAVATTGREMHPLLAYVRGHHLRLYVEMRRDPVAAGPVAIGTIDAATWDGPPLGAGGPFGPMWLGRLGDPAFVATLAVPPTSAAPREVASFLARFREEVGIDRAFYYESNEIARRRHLARPPPRDAIQGALIARGY
ncbi:N(2),N(2)-dimethylguanosine tRNA methyltransferase, partial [mine drainage metagenome]